MASLLSTLFDSKVYNILHLEVSVGFDPITYTVLEGDSEQLVIRKRGETEGPIEIFVSTSGGTATGLYVLDV